MATPTRTARGHCAIIRSTRSSPERQAARTPRPASPAPRTDVGTLEVQLFPNSRRPGTGLKPRREGTRPMLPQHARHCPVLEAGSAAGFMVYAPLEPKESIHVSYEGDGVYKFVYYVQLQEGKSAPIFAVTMTLPVGGVGMMKEEVKFMSPAS